MSEQRGPTELIRELLKQSGEGTTLAQAEAYLERHGMQLGKSTFYKTKKAWATEQESGDNSPPPDSIATPKTLAPAAKKKPQLLSEDDESEDSKPAPTPARKPAAVKEPSLPVSVSISLMSAVRELEKVLGSKRAVKEFVEATLGD